MGRGSRQKTALAWSPRKNLYRSTRIFSGDENEPPFPTLLDWVDRKVDRDYQRMPDQPQYYIAYEDDTDYNMDAMRASRMLPGQIAHDTQGRAFQMIHIGRGRNLLLRSLDDGVFFESGGQEIFLENHSLSFPTIPEESLLLWAQKYQAGSSAEEALGNLCQRGFFDKEVRDRGATYTQIGNWILEAHADGTLSATAHRGPAEARQIIVSVLHPRARALAEIEEWLEESQEASDESLVWRLRNKVARGIGDTDSLREELRQTGFEDTALLLRDDLPLPEEEGSARLLQPVWDSIGKIRP